MTTESTVLRDEIRALYGRRAREELHERDFQRLLTERTVALFRAVIVERLANGEAILAEHHVVRAHFDLNQSILRETDQEAVSTFATDRHLYCVRTTLRPEVMVSADDRDRTVVEEVPWSAVRGVQRRFEIRTGEALAGLGVILFALVFGSFLQITGTLMVALGIAGILHALLRPTRWVEITVQGETPRALRLDAIRKRSARALVSLVAKRVSPAFAGPPGSGVPANGEKVG